MSKNDKNTQAPGHTHTHDHGHDHHHDHDHHHHNHEQVFASGLNRQIPEPSFTHKAMHIASGTFHNATNYLIRTRRANGNFYSQGTRRDQLKRTYPTRVARNTTSIGFAVAENLMLALLSCVYLLCTLGLDSLDTLLGIGIRWSRWLSQPFFVGGSLVLGFRLCTTVALQQPVVWAVIAYVVYACWFVFIAYSYVEHPYYWNLSSWPIRPRAVGRAMKCWYKSPVFWNLVGAGLILKAHVDGITEPLFPIWTPEPELYY